MALRLIGGDLTLDSGTILDEMISSSTDIDADKLQHIHKIGTNFDLAIGATPVARHELVFVCSATARIRSFSALLAVDGSSTSVTFDLKVNGVSVLSSVITVTSSTGDGVVQSATISSPTLTANQRVSIELAVSSSTGAQGPFAWVEIEELAA